MIRQNIGSSHYIICFYASVLITAFLLVSCDATSPQMHTVTPTPTQHAHVSGLSLATPTPTLQPSALRGPVNFLLKTPLQFSDVSGTATDGGGNATQLDTHTIETGINEEFKHLLFMADHNNVVRVYTPGATTPITAQITQHTDGSTTIDYSQTLNSEAGSFSLTFEGSLLNDQMLAIYEQQYSPLVISSVPASDVKVAFTAQVRWVSTSEIPTPPENGAYHFTSNGEIVLSWSAGQNAATYDVYRLIPTQDQQFQWLGTVKDTSYNDTTLAAIQNAHTTQGVAYAIFSLGATGVENPASIVISVSAP